MDQLPWVCKFVQLDDRLVRERDGRLLCICLWGSGWNLLIFLVPVLVLETAHDLLVAPCYCVQEVSSPWSRQAPYPSFPYSC